MIEIDKGSEAYRELERALGNPVTYKIRLREHAGGLVTVKINEGIWSPPLDPTKEE